MAEPRWQFVGAHIFYSSGTITADGNTGVITNPLYTLTAGTNGALVYNPVFPLCFGIIGSDLAAAETNDVTIDWYMESAGSLTLGTTTFAQMTAGAPIPALERWPGDVAVWDVADKPRPSMIPLPAYCKVTWDVDAGAHSSSFVIYCDYLRFSDDFTAP